MDSTIDKDGGANTGGVDDETIVPLSTNAAHTGADTVFSLANIAGSPTTTASGSTTALNSLTTKDETLKVYGYVGDTTISLSLIHI